MGAANKITEGFRVGQTMANNFPSPRELMRSRHPDLFSDSVVEERPILARPVFEYHLETLTARKEEYQFEHFCRLIAEKEICPNLRVQTGPTGGGDSKVDSETYPVAQEISNHWWLGEPSGGSERWAFAFSAKKAWKPKLESDVKNILSTQRDYKRIYFFTNQFVSDKSRASAEDALTKKIGIPVHIVDKSWLVDRVYSHGHLPLAISALQIDNASTDRKARLGPKDTERLTDLDELDAQISDPSRYAGAQYQLIEDCVRAAKLARSLDKPRHEVESRFAMADRLAQELTFPQQQLRIAYHRAWTAHWWFEDYAEFLRLYEEVERFVLRSQEAQDQERLLNLNHLLLGIDERGVLPKDKTRVDDRQAALVKHLELLEADVARPNNALFARMLRTFARLTDLMRARDLSAVGGIWTDLETIARESKQLGQFPFESLSSMVHEMSEMFDSPGFDSLYEVVVDIERQRISDGEAGDSFKARGLQKLKNGKPYEAIRWIGRAEELFIKEEYQRELILTLAAGSYAYKEAGLLWAARNKLLVAIERAFRMLITEGELPLIAYRLLRRLTWIELQLGRVPQILQSLVWTRYCANLVKFEEDDEGDDRSLEETMSMHAVFGMHFLNVPFKRLSTLEQLPDALQRLGLDLPRTAVLYALGHEKRANEEAFPNELQTSAELYDFFEKWQDHPARQDMPAEPTLNEGPRTTLRSIILGAEFVIDCPNDPTSVGVSESLLGAMEAFLSTSDEEDLLPHAERTVICLRKVKEQTTGPTFDWVEGTAGVHAEVLTGESVTFDNAEALTKFTDFLCETTAMVAARCFIIRSPEEWMTRIAGDERGLARATMLGNVLAIGRNLFGGDAKVRLTDWIDADDKWYDCLRDQYWRPSTPAAVSSSPQGPAKRGEGPPPKELMDTSQQKHTERQVLSPINVPIWDQAGWGGTLYGWSGSAPPVMGLMFRNMEAASRIFAEWSARFGQADMDDYLRIAIITGVSKANPTHYAVIVGPNIDRIERMPGTSKTFTLVSRVNWMTPETTKNLDGFLKEFDKYGAFYLMPVKLPDKPSEVPDLESKQYLLKGHIYVRPAWKIGEHDSDMVALDVDEIPVIPDGITDAPVLKAMARKRDRSDK
ncbi:MAG: hypothetical protein V5B39_01120 [Accumulibacter sp.]|jgi:hypothetical protein|uniref:hypothetical protein n=1 Tax=Accumulibacter sp. TaxID=2053492 RepID=UPI002FC32315